MSEVIYASSVWKRIDKDGARVDCTEDEADFDRVDILWAMVEGASHHVPRFQKSGDLDSLEMVDVHIGKTEDGCQLEILSQLRPVDGKGLMRVIFHVMEARPDFVDAVVREERRRLFKVSKKRRNPKTGRRRG